MLDQEIAATRLRVATAQFADAHVVSVNGDLDLHSAPRLQIELDALREDGARKMIVDLVDVPFIDSTALGVLVRAAKQARADKAQLILVSNDPRTLRVLEITGLSRMFVLERSLADAVGAVLDGGS